MSFHKFCHAINGRHGTFYLGALPIPDGTIMSEGPHLKSVVDLKTHLVTHAANACIVSASDANCSTGVTHFTTYWLADERLWFYDANGKVIINVFIKKY